MDHWQDFVYPGLAALVVVRVLVQALYRARYVRWMHPERLPNLTEEELLVGRQSFIGYLVLRPLGIAMVLACLTARPLQQSELLGPTVVAAMVVLAASIWLQRCAAPVVREIVALKQAERATASGADPDDAPGGS